MAFINANTVYVTYNTVAQHEEEILHQLYDLNSKLNTIMASNQELQDALAQVQQALDAEQAQIAALEAASAAVVAAQVQQIADLQAVIADLQAQIEAGATPAQLQDAVDKLSGIKADIESTVSDAPSTPQAEA